MQIDFSGPILPNYLDTKHPLKGTRVLDVLKKNNEYRSNELIQGDILKWGSINWEKDNSIDIYQYLKLGTNRLAENPLGQQYHIVEQLGDFKTRLLSNASFFQGFNWNNVVLAGDSVCNILSNISSLENEYDLFIYGLDENDAHNKVKAIINFFLKLCDGSPNYTVTAIHKGENLMKIYLTKIYDDGLIRQIYEINIIFCLYKTLSETLHSFDLGSMAVGFDGSSVWLTGLSEYAYVNKCNILDTTCRNINYELRLHKYMEKGFKVILPDLRLDHVRDKPLNGPAYANVYLVTDHYGNVSLNYHENVERQETPSNENSISKLICDILVEPFNYNRLVLASRKKLIDMILHEFKIEMNNATPVDENTDIKTWLSRFGRKSLLEFIETGKKPETRDLSFEEMIEWVQIRESRIEEYSTFLKDNLFKIDWKTYNFGSRDNSDLVNPCEWYGSLHWSYENGVGVCKTLDEDDFEIFPEDFEQIYENLDKFIENTKN